MVPLGKLLNLIVLPCLIVKSLIVATPSTNVIPFSLPSTRIVEVTFNPSGAFKVIVIGNSRSRSPRLPLTSFLTSRDPASYSFLNGVSVFPSLILVPVGNVV